MDSPMNLLDILQLEIHFASWMLWALFGLFVVGYFIMTVILYYHWIVYGMKSKGILVAQFIFPVGSAALLYLAFFTLTAF